MIICSVIVLAGLGWYATGLFQSLGTEDSFGATGTEAAAAQAKIESVFGANPASEIVLFERKDASLGDARSPLYQQTVTELLAPLKDNIDSITTYASQPNDALISKDGTATYAIVIGKGTPKEIYQLLSDFQTQADQSRLTISIGGTSASLQQTTNEVAKGLEQAEFITMPILLVLLVLFFRSGVAALVPLGMSAVTIVGAFAIARFVGQFITIDSYAVNVITILGLGLSIDYALLSVNRFREELAAESSVKHAVATIIRTSGNTIFFSGITVIACLLALLLFPMEFLHSIAIGGSAAVIMAIAFTIIILPSILAVVGHHINSWHLPLPRHEAKKTTSGFWYHLARLTTNHPIVTLCGAVIVVGLTLLPLGSFTLASGMNYHWLARGGSAQHVASKIDTEFTVSSPSLTVLSIQPTTLSDDELLSRSCELTTQLQAVTGVKQVVSATPISDTVNCDTIRQIVTYTALSEQEKQYLALSGTPTPSAESVARLKSVQASHSRDNALRFDLILSDESASRAAYDTLERVRALTPHEGESRYIGGTTAVLYDTDAMYARTIPLAIGLIALAMIALLSFHLRSLILPLQAVIINTIAITMSLALLVGIFELGWGNTFTHWGTVEGIVMTPLLLIATMAFGLAMDYSVFLYSRMREVHETTADPKLAIQQGIIKTGPIITAAALMMFVVVSAFATSNVMIMQLIGIGLGIAVLVDAFFVRLFLVPSIMTLMGKASWWLPFTRREK